MEGLADVFFGEVEDRVAAGALVAGVDEGVEGERVVLRGGDLFLDEGAEDAELVGRELHRYKGATEEVAGGAGWVRGLFGVECGEQKVGEEAGVVLRGAGVGCGKDAALVDATDGVHGGPGGGEEVLCGDFAGLGGGGEDGLEVDDGLALPADAAFAVDTLAAEAEDDAIEGLLLVPEGDADADEGGEFSGQ